MVPRDATQQEGGAAAAFDHRPTLISLPMFFVDLGKEGQITRI